MTCHNRTDKQQPKPESCNGISLKYVPTIQKKGLAAVSASFFGCLCAAVGNYDVVHVHAEGPALFCWLPKLMGKRVIVTVHGLDWTRAKWQNGIASKCIKLGEEMAVRYADELIVLSHGMKQYFADTYGARDAADSQRRAELPAVRAGADSASTGWKRTTISSIWGASCRKRANTT